ncbi:hypothetical protein HW555_001900 [Spodoptera exigua]|uniref:Chitin-binding type-2 domain-containing protein n=1 Tax=Spodoptera exigua TaxID=7107 RepID=A0A835GNH2_SPOEX|nr:hypothetical protein HW555_001900 [Spodoptera exigua]
MKDITLVLVCLLANVLANLEGVYNNGCPKDTSINKLLPHENCDQYYQCFHGALITRYCPSGLQFNIKRERCDWHGNPNCKSKKVRTEESQQPDSSEELDNSNPSHAGLICSTPESNGALVAHENCNEFYKCSYGIPVSLKCAPDLLYNPANEKCDAFQNVDCNDRIMPIREKYVTSRTRAKITSSASEICANGPDGVLVVHTSCNKFYKCTGGKAITMSCPVHLLYNPVLQHCDWPQNVDCKDRMVNENDESISSNDEIDDSDEITANDEENVEAICANKNSEGMIVPHEKCNHYYKCQKNIPVDFDCPDNLNFDINKKMCDWPQNVDCGERITSDSESDAESYNPQAEFGQHGHQNEPVNVRAICSAEGSDDTLIAHEYCNQFYKCRAGQAITLTCPGKLFYNPTKEFCDWPNFVDCGDRIVPYSENRNNFRNINNVMKNEDLSDPNDAPEICAAAHSDGTLIAHENCNQFYKCHEGKPMALFCQINRFFNPKKGYCDWQHNVDCENRAIPGENNNGDDDNNLNHLCSGSNEGKILPHENCRQFYKCMNGELYPMDCPPGLYFNTMLKVCDWPTNVDCGERFTESQARNTHGIIRRAHGVVVLSLTLMLVNFCPIRFAADSLYALEKEKLVRDCPSGLHFNSELEMCDLPKNVKCNYSQATDLSDSKGDLLQRRIENPAEICAHENSEGILFPHQKCNQFYQCSGDMGYCDWPSNVNCGQRLIPENNDVEAGDGSNNQGGGEHVGNNADPSEAPKICAADDTNGVLVAHENCNQFYKCFAGKPIALDCPSNLFYNPEKGYCDWQYNVNCNNRVIPAENSDVNDNNFANQSCSGKDDDIIFAHENCNQFYKCVDRHMEPMFCPSGLYYNTILKACDWPINVDCGQRIVLLLLCVAFAHANSSCSPDEEILLPHENCNQFYMCVGGMKIELSCGHGLMFNAELQLCDWLKNVDCSDRIIPEEVDGGNQNEDNEPELPVGGNNYDDPSQAPAICAAEDSDGVLVAHEQCNLFYKCFGGQPIPMECPSSLMYNPEKEYCDWPSNVNCGNRV